MQHTQRTFPARVVRKRRAAKSCHNSTAKPLPLMVIEQPIRVRANLQQAVIGNTELL